MLSALFRLPVGEELSVSCERIWFDGDSDDWVCENVFDTSDADGPNPFMRFGVRSGCVFLSVLSEGSAEDTLEAYFVSGVFVEIFSVYCQSVYFDELRAEWVCEEVSCTSDGDGEAPFLRVSNCFVLKSVNLIT